MQGLSLAEFENLVDPWLETGPFKLCEQYYSLRALKDIVYGSGQHSQAASDIHVLLSAYPAEASGKLGKKTFKSSKGTASQVRISCRLQTILGCPDDTTFPARSRAHSWCAQTELNTIV